MRLPTECHQRLAASAPAVLTEFADPFCATFSRDVLPSVVDRYVRTGKVRLELRVLSFLGEDSVRAGLMAAAAAQQDRLWTFADAFYRSQGTENSGYATDDFLRDIAEATPGLDVDAAFTAREEAAAMDALEEAAGRPARSAPTTRPPSTCGAATALHGPWSPRLSPLRRSRRRSTRR